MALSTGKGALRFQTIDGEDRILIYSTAALAATDAAAIKTALQAGTPVVITIGDGTTYQVNPNNVPQALACDSVVTG